MTGRAYRNLRRGLCWLPEVYYSRPENSGRVAGREEVEAAHEKPAALRVRGKVCARFRAVVVTPSEATSMLRAGLNGNGRARILPHTHAEGPRRVL